MRRVICFAIGFAIVAAGVSIIFLDVNAERFPLRPDPYVLHEACGTAWHAIFSTDNSINMVTECNSAAFPRLWIAGGVAAVGASIATLAIGKRRFLGLYVFLVFFLVLLLTTLIAVAGLAARARMGTG